MPYPHMFSPIKIGNVVFKNRVWTAPAGAHLLYDRNPWPSEDAIAYYINKAAGGAAVITYSAQNMDLYKPEDLAHAAENICNPISHRFFKRMTDGIHFYGAKASLELLAFEYHGRDHAGNLITYSVNEGDVGHGGDTQHMLTRPVMEQIARTYADVAEAAVRCGFDMLLIHGGHGLPLSIFLSPLFNKRTDEFGGCLENRVRFPMMLLDAIRARVGNKLLIEYRISGSELGPDGSFTADDCIQVLKLLQEKIDIAHISAGSFATGTGHITHPNYFLDDGCNSYLAAQVKQSPDIHIPVLTLGAFQDAQDIEDALAAGKADIVSMARGTIADAARVNKAKAGKADEAIPCIKCFHCLDYNCAVNFECSVNPTVGRERILPHLIPPAGEAKRVVVVGGGPAGMEAALIARRRGHEVILLEKDEVLGGKLIFSRQVGFKKDLRRFLDWQIHMIEKLGVDVRLNTEATPELVASLNPDAVAAAVGADPVIPPISGAGGPNVVTAEACYHRVRAGRSLGERVAVLGGGLVGCETALYLAMERGLKVTLVEMLPDIAAGEFHINYDAIKERMDEHVESHVNARCTGITDKGIAYTDGDGAEHFVEAQTVVLAAGMKPRQDLAESFRDPALDFSPLGDCLKASNVRNATRTAYDFAVQL